MGCAGDRHTGGSSSVVRVLDLVTSSLGSLKNFSIAAKKHAAG